MKWYSSTLLRNWPILFSLLIVGCASAPHSTESHLSKEYFTSRNGQLQFRLPVGWLNLTGDSSSSTNTIWLVRSDFAVTLAVREVVIDAGTRSEMKNTGLKRVAELTLALASGEGGVRIVTPPTASSLRGMDVFTYQYIAGQPGDRIHVMLLDTHTRVYEVSMLMTKKISDGSIADVVAVQQSFVENLVW